MTTISPDPADDTLTPETLEQALATQARLVKEVRSMHRLRWIVGICCGVAVVALLGVILAIVAIRRIDDDREASRVEQCQVRNNSARETRRAIDLGQKVSQDRLFLLLRDIKAAFPVSPQFAAFLDAELALPTPDVTPEDYTVDSDCNRDGVISAPDYPSQGTLAA